MDISQKFQHILKKQDFWQPTSRLLLGISSGLDSMVLLHLIANLPGDERPWFGVCHVNHQLRSESRDEEVFLRKYCEDRGIPFFKKTWQQTTNESFSEQAARNFRYQFFEQTMLKQDATHFLTAHHSNDQLETILMRLARGSSLEGMAGIQFNRTFGRGRLVRPLLAFTKAELKGYAAENHIPYCEDMSNATLDYTRNRIRHQVVPPLLQENQQALEHAQRFSEKLTTYLLAMEPLLSEKAASILHIRGEHDWAIDLQQLKKELLPLQEVLLDYILKNTLAKQQIYVQDKQFLQLLDIIKGEAPQKQLDLGRDFVAKRVYQQLFLQKETKMRPSIEERSIDLLLNQWVKLNEHEKIGVFENNQLLVNDLSADEIKNTQKVFLASDTQLRLKARHRLPGDKIALPNGEGHKKVSRIFIDKKVPEELRKNSWLVTDQQDKIIWLINYQKSKLCITEETDKIHYVIIFATDKPQS